MGIGVNCRNKKTIKEEQRKCEDEKTTDAAPAPEVVPGQVRLRLHHNVPNARPLARGEWRSDSRTQRQGLRATEREAPVVAQRALDTNPLDKVG